jgi:hypothetical protein
MAVRGAVIVAMAGVLVFSAGCQRKEQPQPAALPASDTAAKKTDTADIWNEFYSDSAETLQKAKKLPTFSLNDKKKEAAADAPATGYQPAFVTQGRYVVQVATMASKMLADELSLELKEKGYPSYVVEAYNPGALSGTFYRVRIGAFSTRADATAFGENILKPAGFDYWVDRKSGETSPPLGNQFDQSGSGYTPPASTQPAAEPASTPVIVPGPGTNGGWQSESGNW